LSAIAEILTVGHSTHGSEAFVELLRGAGVELVADVRSFPGSRRMPWFGKARLRASLEQAGVDYEHLPELGGRGTRTDEELAHGLERLEALARERRVAVMCAEAQWRRCHRAQLADALAARGWQVVHLGPRGETEPHPPQQSSLEL
jgi:uncharacterized protein (DUF488 family)